MKEDAVYICARPSDGRSTPFSRLRSLGSATFDNARHQSSNAATVHSTGYNVEITFPDTPPISMDLFELARGALRVIVQFTKLVDALLPPGVSIDFPFHRLTDNYSPAALHKQPENVEWLEPYRLGIRKQLFGHLQFFEDSGELDSCLGWLENDQAVLKSFAAVVTLTTGICPSQGDFRIWLDSAKDQMRCIYLTRDKSLILINPAARPKDTEFEPAVYCLPPSIVPTFLFYLTVIVRMFLCNVFLL
ncbi:hypothetical protein HGRIS_001578 [Hohenbuehelia grisea]|uniref:Uncharacterized protein n=1 Tax=Hohenbuehelia grisea TaxID=104357 RepID=A0ABR3JQI0_9AGAR